MANPSELEAIMRSARQQPTWKAAIIESQTWDGTAAENIAKYERAMAADNLGPWACSK